VFQNSETTIVRRLSPHQAPISDRKTAAAHELTVKIEHYCDFTLSSLPPMHLHPSPPSDVPRHRYGDFTEAHTIKLSEFGDKFSQYSSSFSPPALIRIEIRRCQTPPHYYTLEIITY